MLSYPSPRQMPNSHVWFVAAVSSITYLKHFRHHRKSLVPGQELGEVCSSFSGPGGWQSECVRVGSAAGGLGQS